MPDVVASDETSCVLIESATCASPDLMLAARMLASVMIR